MTDITKILEKKSLLDLLCDNCKNYLSVSPVWIGAKGENICGRCESPMGGAFVRNTFYEILARRLQFPCRFHHEGCTVTELFDKINTHEYKCPYRICKCRVKACGWSGTAVELIIHYGSVHRDLWVINDSSKRVVIGQQFFLLAAHGFHYILEWNCSEHGLETLVESLDMNVSDADITFVCRLFSSTVEVPSFSVSSIKLNVRTVLPFEDPCAQLPSMSFSIYILLPPELTTKKLEDLRKLECSKCTQQMVPPIYTCRLQHTCCADCIVIDSDYCGSCEDTDAVFTRTPELELLAVCSLYMCKWSGCGLQFGYKTIRTHEQGCLKRTYTCVHCRQWQGLHDDLLDHDNFCRAKVIFCPMSVDPQVTVLGIRTGELNYSLLAFREQFVVTFLLKSNSAEVTVTNFGPPSFFKWYRYEADMEHMVDFNFSHNHTYELVSTLANQYTVRVSGEEIAEFGGNEFYKLTVKIVKSAS